MRIDATDFEPYLSLGLLVASRKNRSLSVLSKQIEKVILANRPSSERGAPPKPRRVGDFLQSGIAGRGFVYSVQEVPSWLGSGSPSASTTSRPRTGTLNNVHHLVLILKREEVFAVFASHPSDWGRISKGIESRQVQGVNVVAASQLNGAFTHEDWPMPAVWMRGLHRPVDTKADSKQLTGRNVRAAIDPFGDQTYSFSSGRSKVSAGGKIEAVGLSPSRGRIWIGQSRSFSDFCTRASWVMALVSSAQEVFVPIGKLAHPLETTQSLMIPYEVGWVPQGERSDWSQEATDAYDRLEGCSLQLDASASTIVNTKTGRALAAKVRVIDAGRIVVEATLEVDYTDLNNVVKLNVNSGDSDDSQNAWISALRTILRDEQWGILRYESGFVVSGGVAYHPNYSSRKFTSWIWDKFLQPTLIDVTKEKPLKAGASDKRHTDLSQIGEPGDDSIFSWAHARWGVHREGILLCDDGAGEIADFIHLAPADVDGISVLTFVHAKASGSKAQARQLSVSDYEVVVSQAIKNLTYASPDSVVTKLETYSTNASVWTDGVKLGNAKGFANELAARNDLVDIRVVIVQPQTRKSEYFSDSAQKSGVEKARHAQLSALLLEAEASCRSVGATFHVVGSE